MNQHHLCREYDGRSVFVLLLASFAELPLASAEKSSLEPFWYCPLWLFLLKEATSSFCRSTKTTTNSMEFIVVSMAILPGRSLRALFCSFQTTSVRLKFFSRLGTELADALVDAPFPEHSLLGSGFVVVPQNSPVALRDDLFVLVRSVSEPEVSARVFLFRFERSGNTIRRYSSPFAMPAFRNLATGRYMSPYAWPSRLYTLLSLPDTVDLCTILPSKQC